MCSFSLSSQAVKTNSGVKEGQLRFLFDENIKIEVAESAREEARVH